MISVEGLTVRFGTRTIIDSVSFEVFRGEIFLILGESGCGKSTLLKHMMGLSRPSEGTVTIDGVDVNTAEREELRRLRMQVGVLFQSSALFGSMTVRDNVALPLEEYTDLTPDAIDLIVRMKLAMVDLAGYGNHFPNELSGGMKVRAAFARAMALDPSVMFLDEPTSGLDPATASEIDILIESINAGMETTMVIVSQDLASILEIASRAAILDGEEKRIIAIGDPRELKKTSHDPRVCDFFNRRPIGRKRNGG